MKKRLIATAVTVAVGAVLYACGGTNGPSIDVTQGTVLQNATVVNTRDGSLAAGVAVVVDGGIIKQVVSAGVTVNVRGTAQSVDATGKFVVPGYLDMHTHAIDAVDLQPTNWPLFIANGITGIREMRGSSDLIARAKKLNADSAAGAVDAPEVLMMPGEIIGQIPAPATALIATNAAAATAEVQKQKAYGANFIKMFNVNREASLAILAEAKNQGISAAGHLSTALSATESSNAGWKAIEHLGSGVGVLLDCAGDEAAIRTLLLGSATTPGTGGNPNGLLPATWSATPVTAPLYQRVLDSYSDPKCNSMAQTFATNTTWNVPTLIRLRTQHFVDSAAYRTDPNLIYVSKATRASWEASAVARAAFPSTALATFQQYYALQQTIPKLMKKNGAKLLAGSDTALQAPWVIPGFSLHQEFALLAASGLSPLEILQMTTLNGAEFLNRQSTMGTVESGKNADLVVLDANPVIDVANMSKIAGVMLKGKYFAKAALDKQKADVAAAYANQLLATTGPAQEAAHID